MIQRIVALTTILIFAGCAPRERIPTYPSTDQASALRILQARSHSIQTLSAQGQLTLTRPSGDSVRLDAALAMQPPQRLRLRAWKFGQAVFDLTLTPDGLWLVTPQDSSMRDKIRSAGVSAAQLAKTWSLLSGSFFDQPNLKLEEENISRFVLTALAGHDGLTVRCEVDRATLTPRRYVLLDPSGTQRMTLALDHYQQHGQLVYPHRMTAVSEDGTIVIELADIELNGSLPPAAFVPPRRAEKLP